MAATRIATALTINNCRALLLLSKNCICELCPVVKFHFCLLILTSVSAWKTKVYFRLCLSHSLCLFAYHIFCIFMLWRQLPQLHAPHRVASLNKSWNLLSRIKKGNQFSVKCNSNENEKKKSKIYIYIYLCITNQTNKFENKYPCT